MYLDKISFIFICLLNKQNYANVYYILRAIDYASVYVSNIKSKLIILHENFTECFGRLWSEVIK